jgi:rhodanese-related sulfurtransferase
MKQLFRYLLFLMFAGNLLLLNFCNNSIQKVQEQKSSTNETTLLLDFIKKSGDIINSDQDPFLVPADEVFSQLGNYLVIDIRDTSEYEEGHIDGAVLVAPASLIDYLDKTANTSAYEKVVIACHSGQTASYYTTLLRLIGHNNVFALKFGMSGWSRKITPNKLVNSLSNKYAGILTKDMVNSTQQYNFPEIKTGETGGYAIILARAKTVSDEGFAKVKISIDTLMQNPDKYFIVNYWTLEQYNRGHLPGAVQFEPKEAFTKDAKLKNLPTDKPIVVYCLSGQTSASVVAWLRILGYNARTLSLGANAFMHDFVQSYSDKAFSPSRDIADYPLVAGKNPSLQSAPVISNGSSAKEDKAPAVVPVKKKQKASGGGC